MLPGEASRDGPEQKANKRRSDEHAAAPWSRRKAPLFGEVRASEGWGQGGGLGGGLGATEWLSPSREGPWALKGAKEGQGTPFPGRLLPCVLLGLGEPLSVLMGSAPCEGVGVGGGRGGEKTPH